MERKRKKAIMLGIPKWVWVVLITVFLAICSLPILLTQPGWIDFTQTGQIGDTIGGTMGPFIAIVAALLTFIAFWVQYVANVKQREDIAIERIEGKYYKMLDIYSEMSNGLSIHGVQGKEAFAELVGEFTYTFFTINAIYKSIICDQNYLATAKEQIKLIVEDFNNNEIDRNEFLTLLSYNLFYYGRHYMIVDPSHPERTALAEEIKTIVFRLNRIGGHRSFSDYVKSGDFRVNYFHPDIKFFLFEGHSDFLGHYYRHMFQMVKYVASLDGELVDEQTKYGYVKLLRSQMSDYEQILLFYNSLTDQGKAWNQSHGDMFPEEAGFISRFRLIKNLPPNFPVFGVIPQDVYKEDAEKWSRLGKQFYEHKYMPISHGYWKGEQGDGKKSGQP